MPDTVHVCVCVCVYVCVCVCVCVYVIQTPENDKRLLHVVANLWPCSVYWYSKHGTLYRPHWPNDQLCEGQCSAFGSPCRP